MKIQIEKEKVQAAYKDACDGVKEMLIKMFGKEVCEAAKPTLDDYKTIKSYEEACEVLGITQILSLFAHSFQITTIFGKICLSTL